VADAESCLDALVRACGVDLEAPEPCWEQLVFSSSGPSICWPMFAEPGRWSCRCEPGRPLFSAEHGDCQTALRSVCTPTCTGEGDAGRCEITYPDAGQLVVP
jgi:hypothetical protein